MKMQLNSSPCLAAVLLMGFLPATASAQGNSNKNGTVNPDLIPMQPVGSLSAYPTIVKVGDKPDLTWNILYPSSVGNVAIVNPPGEIIVTKNNTYVSVQPIGTGTTDCTTSGTPAQRYAEARISVNGGSYTQLFYGTSADITPQYSLYIKKHSANTVLNFGGRYVKNNAWSDFYTTKSQNMQVVTLKNGDAVPTSFPLHTSPQLASYLGPYLDDEGKVKLGPMSLLVMMELGSTNQSAPCFDCQDMVLLVSFSSRHPNNGHGNNLDGVDSSNPGQGKGGPTGANNTGEDPSGGVDDEGKIIK